MPEMILESSSQAAIQFETILWATRDRLPRPLGLASFKPMFYYFDARPEIKSDVTLKV